MRVVLDTNTVVSGLLWAGSPRDIIALIEQEKVTLCTSPMLIAELRDVIGRPKFSSRLHRIQQSPNEVIERYVEHADIIVDPNQVPAVVASDPTDDPVLACALAAGADYIVSGSASARSEKLPRHPHLKCRRLPGGVSGHAVKR